MSGQIAERHRLALRSIFRRNRGFLPAGQEQIFLEADFREAAGMFVSFFLILIRFPLSAFVLLWTFGNEAPVV